MEHSTFQSLVFGNKGTVYSVQSLVQLQGHSGSEGVRAYRRVSGHSGFLEDFALGVTKEQKINKTTTRTLKVNKTIGNAEIRKLSGRSLRIGLLPYRDSKFEFVRNLNHFKQKRV